MIVEIGEQLAVLLKSFVEPRPVVGVQFVARGLTPCGHLRTLQITHADQPLYEVSHSGWCHIRPAVGDGRAASDTPPVLTPRCEEF